MWEEIRLEFENTPSRLKLIEMFLEFGFAIKQDGIYAGPVQLSYSKIAKASGVDRKVIDVTVAAVRKNKALLTVFENLTPAADISGVAKYNRFAKNKGFGGVLEIEAFSSSIGIAAKATELIKNEGLVVRYLLAKDPELSVQSTMTIVTDKPIHARVVQALLEDKDIIRVSLS
jgi:uncharacterized protein